MTNFVALRFAACCAALMSAAPAFADVTARQVWDSWQDLARQTGSVTVQVGTLKETADGLTASDVVYTSAGPTTSVVTVAQIDLVESGDGTVTVTMSDTIPVTMSGDEMGELDLAIGQTDAVTVVSGTPEALNYDISATQYAVNLIRMKDDTGAPVDLDLRVALNGLSGSTVQSQGDDLSLVYALATESLDLFVDGTNPDDGERVTVSGKIERLAFDADMVLPAGLDMSDTAAMMAAGAKGSGGYGYDAAAYIFATSGGAMPADGTATTGPVRVDFGVDDVGLTYDVSAQDIDASVQGAGLPMPFRMTVASYDLGVVMPLVPTEDPVPFGLTFGLTDVAINDEIWAMADPGAMIPRDPASLRIDLSGQARVTQDLMQDPQDAPMDSFPADLQTLSINDVTLDVAGALLKGVGAFTFDATDTGTFPGMPAPEGTATVTLTGANQLIDRLIAMGVVPQDQAMMGRMMLGMFSTPTGDDTVQTVLEVTADGQILANGQRVR